MSKTIGIIGLGIMGGAFARNLVAAGWRVIGYDIEPARCEEAKAAGVEIADSAAAVAEAASDIITSLPTPRAVLETARTIARAKARKAAPSSRPARWRSTTRASVQRILERGGPHGARLPDVGHRRAGQGEGPRRLRQRRHGRDRAARAGVPRLRAQGLRPRRLRQRQQDEVRRQPPGGDPQRRRRRGHGAGHEGRPRSAPDRWR